MAGTLELTYREITDWPPLAWLSRCRAGTDAVIVWHGPKVESRRDWFCEAVWEGEFESGDFDRTDLVFGSGGRLRDEGLVFVSSGAAVDRLVVLRETDEIWVSNSLPCLLAMRGRRLEPTYAHYGEDISSVRRGLEACRCTLPLVDGKVELVYYDNLRWDGQELTRERKPRSNQRFDSYSGYRGFLERSLGALARNLGAEDRRHRFRLLGTLSSGYDSPASVALARPSGLTEAVSFDFGLSSIEQLDESRPDSGRTIGERLGLRVHEAKAGAWSDSSAAVAPFLAGDARGTLALFNAVEPRLAGTLLLTGLAGDTFWGMKPGPKGTLALGGSASGLSFTEYRLWVGFLHCPVPYLGATRADEIRAISLSEEMAPWSLGGGYDRPICRRILEEAGVPRNAFGMTKKGARVRFSNRETFWACSFAKDFVGWVEAHRGRWLRSRRVPPDVVSRVAAPVQTGLLRCLRAAGRHRVINTQAHTLTRRLVFLGSREWMFKYVFAWAVEQAGTRYGPPATALPD